MSRQTYRIELEIISDILEVIVEAGASGRYITEIVRDANLSHNVALDKLKKLIDAGLLVTSEGERNKVFVMTEDGIKFYRELRNFEELTCQIRGGHSFRQEACK
ncbi:MAG: transcriptional regulator [Thaumarchaeota archaeon]|nr:transcriptional regulator [Nitrososphaerota archaeon]MBI3641702.1 transcriptional regulator [Nitrososphaerota archaeon]